MLSVLLHKKKKSIYFDYEKRFIVFIMCFSPNIHYRTFLFGWLATAKEQLISEYQREKSFIPPLKKNLGITVRKFTHYF